MTGVVAVGALPSDARRLVRLMQEVGYGRIEGLRVRDGRPTWQPKPRVLLVAKPGGQNRRRPAVPTEDFALKQQVRELIAYLEAKRQGILHSIDVQDGLPFKWVFEEDIA